MRKANYTRTIYFLCLDQHEANPYLDELIIQLNLSIPRVEPEALIHTCPSDKHKILLLDHSTFPLLQRRLGRRSLNNKHYETILINVKKRLSTDEILTFGHLKGLFYEQDCPSEIAQKLGDIINGTNSLPRNILNQLLHYYRHAFDAHKTQMTIELTAREIQILRSLQSGVSNHQIADDLFISEFTVKSHLYQIFKKLSVRNRTQAIAWANQNILS